MSAGRRLGRERIRDIAAGAAACAVAATIVGGASAAAIALTGAADDARRLLRFGFAGLERTPAEVLRIAAHNARLVGGVLLCALLAPRLPPRARALVTLLLAAVLAVNAVAVGVALGAYGGRLIRLVALHVPVELAALAVAGGAYLSTGAYVSASRQPLRGFELVCVAALCAALLVIAAALETYAPLGGLP